MRPRLFLITPVDEPADRMTGRVSEAFSGGDIASLLIDVKSIDPANRQTTVKSLVEACHQRDVAAIIRNDTQLAGRADADGVHIDTDIDDLETVLESFKPRKIVGVGGIASRHEALLVGELDIDYMFFGQVDRPEDESADPVAVAMAGWWSPMIEIPCVALAGTSDASIEQACETGAEFIGLRAYIWDRDGNPAEAIRNANAILDRFKGE